MIIINTWSKKSSLPSFLKLPRFRSAGVQPSCPFLEGFAMHAFVSGCSAPVPRLTNKTPPIPILSIYHLPSLKLTSPLKMDGWNTIVSFRDGLIFGCELFVSGRVRLFQNWKFPSPFGIQKNSGVRKTTPFGSEFSDRTGKKDNLALKDDKGIQLLLPEIFSNLGWVIARCQIFGK